jgi:hypothetical protein
MLMSNPEPDFDNPLWTREDFVRALGPASLPDAMLAAFPTTSARLTKPLPNAARPLLHALQVQSGGARWQLAA